MLTDRLARKWRWRIPPVGIIVTVRMRPLDPDHRYRRFIVEALPGPGPRSRYTTAPSLVHCATIRALDNGARHTVAGHWLHEEE